MALLCAFLLQRILRRLQRKRDMVFHVFVSLAVRVLVIGLYLANLLTLHIRLFPVGEFWYGNAFEYLLMIVGYLICSGVLRLGALAARLIRCPEKQ